MLKVSVAIAVVVTSLTGGLPAHNGPACDREIAATIGCPTVSNTGTEVAVGGSRTDSDSSDPGGGGAPGEHVPVPTWPLEPTNPRPCDAAGGVCERPDLPAEPVDPGFPEVTLADLVSFRPVTPELSGEPRGFGVVGMPTNFVTAASEQSLDGVLLGHPVTVRFTPTAFVFSYGDGTSARSAGGGVSWQQAGAPQFSPTDTSHVYRERGTYTASVTVEYAAAVNFGVGWRPVEGVVTAASGAYPVEVVEVHTALVDRTCDENPAGPGC